MTSDNKNKIVFKIMRWDATINKFAFFAYETFRALLSKRRIKILFSQNAEREEDIKKKFRLLHHQISFDEFTPENIKKNDLVVPLNMYNLRQLISYRELAKNNPIPTGNRSGTEGIYNASFIQGWQGSGRFKCYLYFLFAHLC